MRVVVALGGNALQRRGEKAEPQATERNLRIAARALAKLAPSHELVITHGNGPQVGMLALAAEEAGRDDPLDILVAETEGAIGYLLEIALNAELPGREMATLLTQVEVDLNDPGFRSPSKPIGRCYTEVEARRLAAERSWTIVRDGAMFRRAVVSPQPRRIREINAIRILIEAGALVICSGGGGIPVAVAADGSLHGVEAVIDKDLSAALLAEQLGATALLLLTDVAAVMTKWNDPAAQAIAQASPEQLRALQFERGTMAPKIDAACRFVERTGGFTGVGAIENAAEILAGVSGTLIRATDEPVRYHA